MARYGKSSAITPLEGDAFLDLADQRGAVLLQRALEAEIPFGQAQAPASQRTSSVFLPLWRSATRCLAWAASSSKIMPAPPAVGLGDERLQRSACGCAPPSISFAASATPSACVFRLSADVQPRPAFRSTASRFGPFAPEKDIARDRRVFLRRAAREIGFQAGGQPKSRLIS